jgi:hypothetical protein
MSTQSEIREVFHAHFHRNTNCVTPSIERYYGSIEKGLICELSHGEGITRGTTIFGATFLQLINGQWTKTKINESFNNKNNAVYYIQEKLKTGIEVTV